jgi:hypothetical protein
VCALSLRGRRINLRNLSGTLKMYGGAEHHLRRERITDSLAMQGFSI